MTAKNDLGYRQIALDLSRRIIDGEFTRDSVLPPEHRLVEHYGVARGTVRHALAALARQGTLSPRQGSGWTIQSTLQTQSFAHLRSFAQWAVSKGMVPGGRVTDTARCRADARESRRLRVALHDEVLRVTRIRSLDGRDVMLERTTYPRWVADAIESLPADEPSVVQAMHDRFGIVTAHADHTIDAVSASSADSALLSVRRSSPLLRVLRVSYATDGRAIEFGDDRYLPGTVSFQVSTSVTTNSLMRNASPAD
ncbi:GntR family transcriptional regulator [Mycetocola sp.]|uniref:GntR family transcriptional regulator n=1 Tax=Mycetocola sp. TaxID=1871042 RepID=UPI0039896648